MVDGVMNSDSDDGDNIEWEPDGEDGPYDDDNTDCEPDGEAEPLPAWAFSNLGAPDLSTGNNDANALLELFLTYMYKELDDDVDDDLDFVNWDLSTLDADMWADGEPPSSSLHQYVGKGFPKEMDLKAIKASENNDANQLHEQLLPYMELGDYNLLDNFSTSGCTPDNVEDDDDDDLDFVNRDGDNDHVGEREANSDGSTAEELLAMDKKIKFVVDQGFSKDEANMIITRIGVGSSFFVLVDSTRKVPKMSFGVITKARFREERKKRRKCYGGREQVYQDPVDGSHDESMTFPNPMVGFNLPGFMVSTDRRLPELANGPPFFYYENVARAPKGVWRTISEKLYDVEPELVDSKYLCAVARQRGYVHNLPIKDRKLLRPLPPKTIFEAFPHYKKWWPPWDPRSNFNCLTTCVPSTKLSEQIEHVLGRVDNTPSLSVQKAVIDVCKDSNLVWVGKNKVAALEPDEMEYVLGFPKDHTRGVCITKRYKSLGNSFQVDTVAYHLSVLRDMFPDGMKVLSLFSGIGGAEVALHRLEIHLSIVVSVEISEVNRRILRGWWNQTQTGWLIEIPDVRNLTDDIVEYLTTEFGGFDLVIGGSPCNNLAGRNRFHRDGLEGEQSALFYHYFRILDAVKSVMARM